MIKHYTNDQERGAYTLPPAALINWPDLHGKLLRVYVYEDLALGRKDAKAVKHLIVCLHDEKTHQKYVVHEGFYDADGNKVS